MNKRKDNPIIEISGIEIDYHTYSHITKPGEQFANNPELLVKQRPDSKWYIHFILIRHPPPENAMEESGYITIPFDTEKDAYDFQEACIARSLAITKWMNQRQ